MKNFTDYPERILISSSLRFRVPDRCCASNLKSKDCGRHILASESIKYGLPSLRAKMTVSITQADCSSWPIKSLSLAEFITYFHAFEISAKANQTPAAALDDLGKKVKSVVCDQPKPFVHSLTCADDSASMPTFRPNYEWCATLFYSSPQGMTDYELLRMEGTGSIHAKVRTRSIIFY